MRRLIAPPSSFLLRTLRRWQFRYSLHGTRRNSQPPCSSLGFAHCFCYPSFFVCVLVCALCDGDKSSDYSRQNKIK